MTGTRLTKIVVTVGPASETPEALEQLLRAGADVFRLNSAHATVEELAQRLSDIRTISEKLSRPVAVLVDLAGPKIRVGPVETGSQVELVCGEEVGTPERVATTYGGLLDDVEPGSRILLDDGLIELAVKEKAADSALCHVVAGGELRSHKGVNLPGVAISAPTITEEDRKVIGWALGADVDFLGISFVRRAEDVRELRTILHEHDSPIRVIAKIEKPEAVAELEAIVELADGVMVARGDLGVEMPLEDVPLLQKRIIQLCRTRHRPVITATQMLESMMERPRPTRAEVSDIANAILDGTDAVMLSGETAVGKFPVAAVAVMDRVARVTERYLADNQPPARSADFDPQRAVASALSEGAYQVAQLLCPTVVAVSSASGDTALLLSKERMSIRIIGASADPQAVARMALYYGVRPVLAEKLTSLDDLFALADEVAVTEGLADRGDPVLLVAGDPFGISGTTNTLQVRRVRSRAAKREPEVRRWEHRRPEGTFFYEVHPESCMSCGVCVLRCPAGVGKLEGGRATVVEDRLEGCVLERACERDCPTGAISINQQTRSQVQGESQEKRDEG